MGYGANSARLAAANGLAALADEELMHLIRAREPAAFEVVYDRHAGAAFSLAYRICGKPTIAEDVTQEAFLAVWRGARYQRARGSVRNWILAIAHNHAIDALRARSRRDRRQTHAEGIEERVVAPERTDDQVARRQEAAELRAALRELPADQSQVIELAFFDGLTHSEIADVLAVPLGTVKGRLRLGLAKMRLTLDATGLVPA